MRLIPLDSEKKAERQTITQRADKLKAQGICPTCRDMQHGDVYPAAADRVFYEDDIVRCMLEAWPRNPGHTIVLVKPHFEDLSEMSSGLGAKVLPIIQVVTASLKEVLGAEKVYLCTMCDGRRNHLHFQLIPRMPGDTITGSKLFVKDRSYLDDYVDVVQQLKCVCGRLRRATDVASHLE
jgi:histidine triad (HIT) family protein